LVVRELGYVLNKVREFLFDDLAQAAFGQETRLPCGSLYRAPVEEAI